MSSIIIKNGIKRATFDNYELYEMYTKDANKYYMCLPIDHVDSYQMVIDFPEEYYKSLREEDTIDEIKNVCNMLYSQQHNYIYVLPNVTSYDAEEAKSENDSHAYRNLLNSLNKYTYDVYHALSENKNIVLSQTIGIIIQSDSDKKIINGFNAEIPEAFESISLNHADSNIININEDTGWTTMGGPVNGGVSAEVNNSMNKPKVKKLATVNKHGFLNITFIITIVLISIVLGIWFAITLIK